MCLDLKIKINKHTTAQQASAIANQFRSGAMQKNGEKRRSRTEIAITHAFVPYLAAFALCGLKEKKRRATRYNYSAW